MICLPVLLTSADMDDEERKEKDKGKEKVKEEKDKGREKGEQDTKVERRVIAVIVACDKRDKTE